MVESGGKQSTSDIRDTTTPYLLGQEIGNSGKMFGPTAQIRCVCKGYGLQGRGEALGAVVYTCDNVETAEGRGRKYFGGGKGSAASRIWQAWRDQGRG